MIADRIAIIDHGKLISIGTAEELMQQTGTDNLEKAYLELTGKQVRDETLSLADGRKDMIRRIVNR